MEFARPKEIIITNAGGVFPITVNSTENYYVVTGTAALANDCSITFDVSPADGTTCVIEYRAVVTIGAKSMTVLGTTLTANQALKKCFIIGRVYGGVINSPVFIDLSQSSVLETAMFVDKCVTLAKMEDKTRGMLLRYGAAGVIETFVANTNAQILIGNGTDLVSVAQSGNVLFANNGQSTIQAGVIVNAMIAAGAVIAWSKMATSNPARIIVFSGANVPTPVDVTGDVTISNTGVTTIGAAKVQASMLDTDTSLVPFSQYISFESGELQDNDFLADFDGEIVSGEASVTTVIGATDAANIQFKIDGTNVTNGSMSFPAASIVGTKDACTPTAVNTFTQGQTISMTCTKATDNGGHVNCKILLRRT